MTSSVVATTLVRQLDTHRLVPSRYASGGSHALAAIAGPADLDLMRDLAAGTDDRLLAEAGRLDGIGPHELVFGVPHARIVNAAFIHPHPLGSRFNGASRGAWYAGCAVETAQTEVAFHKTVEYAEIGRWDDSVTYDDFLADVGGVLHDLRGLRKDDPHAACLDPRSYVASQTLAQQLLQEGSLGIVYPSVRHPGGTCIACFRPALVAHVRRAETYRLTWSGSPTPQIAVER